MGLHQDRDEADFAAPVVSLSLGDSCLFRVGGLKRGDPTHSFRLNSGDVVVLGGGARLAFHGVDRIYPGTSTLLAEGGRINLTMRRVTRSNAVQDAARRRTCLALAVQANPMPIRSSRTCAGFSARLIAAVAAIVIRAVPALAADPIFPTGSRLGIVPPTGMVQSRNFIGFEDPQKNAAILFTTLPAQAYDSLDKSMVPEAMKKDGIEIDKREPIELTIGKGFLLSGTQTTNKARYRKWLLVAAAGNVTALVTIQVPEQDEAYTDKVLRDTLATLALRDSVPDAEQLSLLPFIIGDMAGFHIDEVLPGRALMLVDKPPDPASNQAKGQSNDSGKDSAKDQSRRAYPQRTLVHCRHARRSGGAG